MLLFADVDRHVGAARVLADDHTLVHFHAGADEERAALFSVFERVGGGETHFHRDNRTCGARVHRASHLIVTMEDGVHDTVAARGGEELIAESEQAARGCDEDHAGRVLTGIVHLHHFAAATPEHFHDHTDRVVAGLHVNLFVRFEQCAIVRIVIDDFWTRDLELIALAPHRFDQDAEVQFTATADEERLGGLGSLDAQRDVGAEFVKQAFP